jgi:hypothetical protein
VTAGDKVMSADVYQNYLLDLSTLLRDQYADRSRQVDDFERGYRMALMSVLSLMIQQADAFRIDRASIGLGGLDPERELA